MLEHDNYESPPGYGVMHNPWFSPPALQYVARFTGNPPGFRAGDRVTWSEEALNLEIGRPGQVMRVRYPGRHRDDAGRTSIEFDSGRSRMVNNWEILRAAESNPPGYGSSMLEYDNYESPPGYGVMHNPWERVNKAHEAQCANCGYPLYSGDRGWWSEDKGMYFCSPECASTSRNPPGYGSSMLEYDNYESPPGYGVMHNPKHDVLCQCGWGRLGMEESEIPDHCPVCDHSLGHQEDESEGSEWHEGHGTGRHPLIDYWREQGLRDAEDPDYDSYPNPARGNPGDTITIRGRGVPVDHSAKGGYHHVRVADPSEFKAIRTKVLSARKGIKARVGIFKGRGPRGGKSEIQSYLFDAKIYTPQDVVRWIEGHKTPAPLRMEISSASTSKRRMKVYGVAAETPRKKRKSAKAKVKRKPRKVPADSKRCTAKGKKGRCKGYRQAGKTQCALHAAGVAGRFQPKKKKRKVG